MLREAAIPTRPYLPSSPYVAAEAGRGARRLTCTPEQHLWGPRDYFKSAVLHGRHSAHFIGEIGYHGCPNVASIRAVHLARSTSGPGRTTTSGRLHCTSTTGSTERLDLTASS